jgi:hypothetical protein
LSLDVPVQDDDLDGCPRILAPQLGALPAARRSDPSLSGDLVLMVESEPLGAWFDVTPAAVEVLAAAGCGLSIGSDDSDEAATADD